MRALGVMSGTSLDGVDIAFLETDGHSVHHLGPHKTYPYPASLRAALYGVLGKMNVDPDIENALTSVYIQNIQTFLKEFSIDPWQIDVIGLHGQTIHHQPRVMDGDKVVHKAVTCQIGKGQAMADALQIPVVYQLRLNDIEHGGEGAPLVPVFQQALAGDIPKPVAFLNIGGVSNLTWIGDDDLIAFDVGPGNALIDDLMHERTGNSMDKGGEVAAKGIPHQSSLEQFLSHPYFERPFPKSLDRQTFKTFCLHKGLSTEDAAATLTAFTVRAIEAAARLLPKAPLNWYVCGGGVHNQTLMNQLKESFGTEKVQTVEELNLAPDAMEAQAWAFLAVRSKLGLPITFPLTTGIKKPLGGGVYCAPHKG